MGRGSGRGLRTQAHTHSLMADHHVFLNLHTLRFYCLPDNYEVVDASLEDIAVRARGGRWRRGLRGR